MVPDPSITPSGSGAGQAQSNGSNPSRSGRNESVQSELPDPPDPSSDESVRDGEQESAPMGTEELQETADLLNKTSNILNRDLQFTVLPEENVVQAEIVNRENDEVIQKIPPDELIELRKTIDTFIGLFVDEMR